MELNCAKEKLENIVNEYKSKISKLDINTRADVYVGDSKALTKIEDDPDNFDLLFASITIASDNYDEENDNNTCGFDLIVDVKKKSEVNDKEFDNALSEFCAYAEDFIKRLEDAPDKNEFIKNATRDGRVFSCYELKRSAELLCPVYFFQQDTAEEGFQYLR